jgi:type VI secretion system protein ImpJ
MPDGLVFDIPEGDHPPAPRNVQDYFAATADKLGVFLVTPVERQDGGNIILQQAESRRETRYRTETVHLSDENTGSDLRAVEVARPGFQIRFMGESLLEYTTIQLAEVVRNPNGTFQLNDRFVPPCLRLEASERLMALGRRLLELLVGKSASLVDRSRAAAQQREVSPGDVTALGLLSTVNAYLPVLRHQVTHGLSHPEALYLSLVGLAGQLTAYVPESGVHPRDFPAYDHAAPTTCFNRLGELLVQMLGGARVQANYVELPMRMERQNLYRAAIDEALLESAQFFLIARSDALAEDQLIRELPRMLRIASPDTIEAVLRSYTRALTIEHTHRLPSALPVDAQANYFQLQKRGPFWEAICDSKALALFLPSEFSGVDLKLVAVQSP